MLRRKSWPIHFIYPLTNDNLIQALTDADVAKIAKLIKIENV
jgi:hypothetical protein